MITFFSNQQTQLYTDYLTPCLIWRNKVAASNKTMTTSKDTITPQPRTTPMLVDEGLWSVTLILDRIKALVSLFTTFNSFVISSIFSISSSVELNWYAIAALGQAQAEINVIV